MTSATKRMPAETVAETGTWTVATAKARFSQVIERARVRGPQTITRHGRPAVVVLALEEWERSTPRVGTFADAVGTSTLRVADDLAIEQRVGLPRFDEV
jgi:prevent-host-death family protein